jgi:hypothetical protein
VWTVLTAEKGFQRRPRTWRLIWCPTPHHFGNLISPSGVTAVDRQIAPLPVQFQQRADEVIE